MPGVEINNKTRGSDSFDRGIEDDDLAFLPPTEDDLRRFTVSGSNPGASESGSNATDGNNPNLINESESNVTNASGPVTLILKNDHSSTRGRGARNVSLDDPIVILPKSQVTVDKTNKSLSFRSKPDTVDQKDRLKNSNNGIPVNTSIDQSIQSKGSIRSATSNVVLAGISVGAVGLGIHSDSSMISYASYASAALTVSCGVAGFPGFFANMIANFTKVTKDIEDISDTDSASKGRETLNVLLIMQVLGLNTKEAELMMDSMQVTDIDNFVLVENQSFSNTLVQIGVNPDRVIRLENGFSTFKHFHASQDIEKIVKNGECDSVTYENAFDVTTYNSVLHRRLLRTSKRDNVFSPTNLDLQIQENQGGFMVSPMIDSHVSRKKKTGSVIIFQENVPQIVGTTSKTDNPQPLIQTCAGMGGGGGDDDDDDGSKKSNKGDKDRSIRIPELKSVSFDNDNPNDLPAPNTPKGSEGNGGGGDDDGNGNSSDKSASDSDDDSSTCPSEEEELYISSRGIRYMDASKNPLPAIPAPQKQVKQYVLKLNFEIEGINASRLTEKDKEDRFQKPHWKGGKKKKGSSWRKYRKQLKIFEELDRGILHYIRCTALASNHQLKTHLGRIKSGIEAYDYILNELDPISYDKMSSSAEAVSTFEALKLTSISKGSFSSFQVKFMDCLDDLAANGLASAEDDEYLKLSLLNKLPPSGYKHIFLQDGIFDDLNFKETLAKIAKTAVHVERDEKPSTSKNGSRINNTTSTTSEIPEEIGGFKVNKSGIVDGETWKKMQSEDRKSYWDAKNQMREDGIIFPPREDTFNKRGEKGDSSESMKQKAHIKKLQKQLKKENDDSVASTSSPKKDSKKDSDKANINTMTFAEVLNRMPKDNASKASDYIKSKISVTRTGSATHKVGISKEHFRIVQNLMSDSGKYFVIVDGGADTGLKGGKTSRFLEHSLRRVTVSGYEDDMVTENLPIGTSATKITDVNGKQLILIENEQIDHTGQDNSIMSVNQVRAFGVDVDDCPAIYSRNGVQGRQSMVSNDIEIPFTFDRNLILLEASKPSEKDLLTLPYLVITSGMEWNPEAVSLPLQGTTQWEPLPSDDLGIVDSSAHGIVRNRLETGGNVYHVSMATALEEQFDTADVPSLYNQVDLDPNVNLVLDYESDDSLFSQPRLLVDDASLASSFDRSNYTERREDDTVSASSDDISSNDYESLHDLIERNQNTDINSDSDSDDEETVSSSLRSV